ncbi:uncharacterized protein [Acropora muricata]|uniref:uncharacterized protein n=1 Tax=Acropora muricata TaxID=159855 RepID=UPI0034E5251D
MSFAGVKMSAKNDSRADEFPLHHAVRRGDVHTVESLLKHGTDPNEKDHRETTAIHYVNHLNEDADRMVHVLLKFGGDMLSRNCYGMLPFEEALSLSNKKSCEAFVDWGFSLEKYHRMHNGTYELLHKVQLFQPGARETLQVLVDLGVDLTTTLSSRGETLLHQAVESGASSETIQFLIRSGVSVNQQNCLGMTPLHMMRFTDCNLDWNEEEKYRHSEVIRCFIKEGYHVDSQDIFGCTVVHYVVSEMRQSSILRYLISHGANLNMKDRNGVTPLHLACFWRNITNVTEMIEGGSLTDIRDNQGATIFHYTVFYNNPTVLRYILTDLCEPSLVGTADYSGRTPLQLAMCFGYVELIELFKSYFQSFAEGPNQFMVNMPDLFPLKDEYDVFQQEEVDSMASEDFILKDDQNRTLNKLLNSPVLGIMPKLDEEKEVEKAVTKLIERVAVKVCKNCPLFSFEPKLSGSLSEGTKCGLPDEFDFLCTMRELSKVFLDPVVDSSPPMFGQLQLRPEIYLSDHNVLQYADKDKSLRSAKLMEDLTEELNRAFLEKGIWEDMPGLSPVSFFEKKANATTTRISWHGHLFKDMLISIDLVPAVYFPNFWPPNVSQTALLTPKIKNNGTHVVFALHNNQFFKCQKKHFRLSFSLAETEIFRTLPEQVRLGYVLAKAIRNSYVCPQIAPKKSLPTSSGPQLQCSTEKDQKVIDCFEQSLSGKEQQYIPEGEKEEEEEAELIEPEDKDVHADKMITSYLLKNALFALVSKSFHRELSVDPQNLSQDQVIVWAKLLYDYIEDCLREEKLPSFFVPSCNLLNRKYDSGQHELVFKSGAEFEPLNVLDDDDDESQDLDDTEEDVAYLRKLFVKMLKGILKSQ